MPANEFLYQGRIELERADRCVAAFYEKFDIVPSLDSEGCSPCGFAEAMYRQAYEQEWFLRQELERLRVLVDSADAHLDQTERELHDVQEGDVDSALKRLNLEISLDRARRMVVALRRAGDEGRAALRDADKKRFPGMKRWTEADFHR